MVTESRGPQGNTGDTTILSYSSVRDTWLAIEGKRHTGDCIPWTEPRCGVLQGDEKGYSSNLDSFHALPDT